MVQWKGEIEREQSGEKAALLDSFEGLNVPNFFVITRNEVKRFVKDKRRAEEILNSEMPSDLLEDVKEACKNVGMSSEVRNASGKAQDLVGGQRDTQKVSIRVSNGKQGVFDYKLNVGSSSIENALKQVIASFYNVETDEEYPAILVQKMVEAEHTGAVLNSYLGSYGLVESVEGLGISLDEGITRPDIYLLENGSVTDVAVPDRQIKITLHPMNGEHRRKNIAKDSPPFSEHEVEELYQKVQDRGLNVKFAYKRGTFYIVDVFEPESFNPFSPETSLKALKVSPGEINGVIGEEVALSDKTLPPEKYDQALIARRGGYTSADAQKARAEGKPALFSSKLELEEGQRIHLDAKAVEPGEEQESTVSRDRSISSVTGTEVLPVDSGSRAVHLSPPYGDGYAVTDHPVRSEKIDPSGYLTSYADVFRFSGDRAVLDARDLDQKALPAAIEYLDAELKILILGRPQPETVRSAIENGFDVIASQDSMQDYLQNLVEREERRFIMEKLRNLDSD